MKSVLFAFIGVVLYGIQNAIIDVKLRQYSTASLILGLYVTLLPCAVALFIYQLKFGGEMIVPRGKDLGLVALVALMFFLADFFYLGAFAMGGNAVVLTILFSLMPVVVIMTKFLWGVRDAPTTYHLLAFACAFLAATFVAVGEAEKKDATPTEVKKGG